ncbi:MAG: flagellar protein FliT, partial [Rhizobium sp.]|nr:flagellar protein FliT [Rhizobium sp.]
LPSPSNIPSPLEPETFMTSHEILTTYESLSELTGSMLNAARQGEWDDLAVLEQRCQAYVGSLMQTDRVRLNENEQRTKVAIIRTILQNDAQIRALAEPRLHELQQRLSLSRASQRSVKAYNAQRT